MPSEWTVRIVGEDGMEIRRSYSQDARGLVTISEEVVGRAEVQAAEDAGTYNVVNFYGQTVDRFTVSDVGSIVYAKGEPTEQTIVGTYQYSLLPDGTPGTLRDGWKYCSCFSCLKLKGANMDRDQVARIAAEIGSSLMPDNSQWVNRFTVESTSSSRTYTVAQRRSDDVWGCSCPSWINRRHCKHLTDILERLAKLTAFDVTDPAVLEMLRSARVAYLDLDTAPGTYGRAEAPTYHRHIDL